MEKVVCPPQLRGGVFTTAAVDNIDHNPSSTSAYDSFHGTGISLFQHPDSNCIGIPRAAITMNYDSTKRTMASLPESYTTIPPSTLIKQDIPVPKQGGPNKADCLLIPQAMQKEYGYVLSR